MKILLLVISILIGTGVAYAGSGHNSWSYSGQGGPEHWGDLNAEYVTCKAGSRQSPIDISYDQMVKASLGGIEFDYKNVLPEIINNGHTIQVNYDEGSSISVAGQKYNLLQFHFHTPSENTVDGKPYDMEMHLVHKNDKGQLAVVGILLKKGKQNAELQKAWDKMPDSAGGKDKLASRLNAANLLPAKREYVHFNGSLTTPPCSEGVNWFVMQEAVELSGKQINQFTKVIGANARPVQELNNRFVLAKQ